MRVSAEETPKYIRKQMKREVTMPSGMERCGWRASSPAGMEQTKSEALSGHHTRTLSTRCSRSRLPIPPPALHFYALDRAGTTTPVVAIQSNPMKAKKHVAAPRRIPLKPKGTNPPEPRGPKLWQEKE